MVSGRTCSGFSSPGGTAPTVTPVLPNSMVANVVIVSPFLGETKKTLSPPAPLDDPAGASAPPQAATESVNAAMTRPSTTRLTIATPLLCENQLGRIIRCLCTVDRLDTVTPLC